MVARDFYLRHDLLLNKMKLGRPTLCIREKKTQIKGVRLRTDERAKLEIAAKRDNKHLSEWIRDILLVAASRRVRNR